MSINQQDPFVALLDFGYVFLCHGKPLFMIRERFKNDIAVLVVFVNDEYGFAPHAVQRLDHDVGLFRQESIEVLKSAAYECGRTTLWKPGGE